jgi:hypothetical protein
MEVSMSFSTVIGVALALLFLGHYAFCLALFGFWRLSSSRRQRVSGDCVGIGFAVDRQAGIQHAFHRVER